MCVCVRDPSGTFKRGPRGAHEASSTAACGRSSKFNSPRKKKKRKSLWKKRRERNKKEAPKKTGEPERQRTRCSPCFGGRRSADRHTSTWPVFLVVVVVVVVAVVVVVVWPPMGNEETPRRAFRLATEAERETRRNGESRRIRMAHLGHRFAADAHTHTHTQKTNETKNKTVEKPLVGRRSYRWVRYRLIDRRKSIIEVIETGYTRFRRLKPLVR